MKVPIRGKPTTVAKILDSQGRGIGFTIVRVEILRQAQLHMPALALVAEVHGRVINVQLEMLELDDLKVLSMLNASASSA